MMMDMSDLQRSSTDETVASAGVQTSSPPTPKDAPKQKRPRDGQDADDFSHTTRPSSDIGGSGGPTQASTNTAAAPHAPDHPDVISSPTHLREPFQNLRETAVFSRRSSLPAAAPTKEAVTSVQSVSTQPSEHEPPSRRGPRKEEEAQLKEQTSATPSVSTSDAAPPPSSVRPFPPATQVHIKSRGGLQQLPPLPPLALGGDKDKGAAAKAASTSTGAITQQHQTSSSHNGIPSTTTTGHLKIFGGSPSHSTSNLHSAVAASAAAHPHVAHHPHPFSLTAGATHTTTAVQPFSPSKNAPPKNQHDRFVDLFKRALADIVPVATPPGGGSAAEVSSGGGTGGGGGGDVGRTASATALPAASTEAATTVNLDALATDIANALEALSTDPSTRAKTLLFHLRDTTNTQLRSALAKGKLTGAAFVNMNTFTQLFNEEKRADAKAHWLATDSYHDRLREESKALMAAGSSLYECPRCRARKHTITQLQPGGHSDEPLVEICQCLMCSNTWRSTD